MGILCPIRAAKLDKILQMTMPPKAQKRFGGIKKMIIGDYLSFFNL